MQDVLARTSQTETAQAPSPAPVDGRNVVASTAATLTVIETAIGSVVHGFKIPLGGHLLSLNQGLFLTRVLKRTEGTAGAWRAPFTVSTISAVLKSLSPAGNKLGPMLSISAQGFLFTSAVALLGANAVGVALGMALSSIWAFAQPFLTLYLFFGHGMAEAIGFYLEKMRDALGVEPSFVVGALATAVAVKAAIAVAIGLYALKASDKSFARVEDWLTRLGSRGPSPNRSASRTLTARERWGEVGRDLRRPLFLVSLLLMGAFFFFNEGSIARTFWLLLRPLAIAILFFWFARSPAFAKLAVKLRERERFAGWMAHFDDTLSRLRGRPARPPTRHDRVLVIGLPGAGKSTFARSLAQAHGLRHVEADAHFRDDRGTQRPRDEFRARVANEIAQSGFVLEGHFRDLKDLIGPAVTRVYWIDRPLAIIVWRNFKRALATRAFGTLKFLFHHHANLREIQKIAVDDFRARGLSVERV